MSVFTKDEREYLSGFRLGRLATVGLDGTPHVVPTGFRYNSDNDTIDIGGHHFAKRKKYRDVVSGAHIRRNRGRRVVGTTQMRHSLPPPRLWSAR